MRSDLPPGYRPISKEGRDRKGTERPIQLSFFENDRPGVNEGTVDLRTLTDWHLIDRSVTTQSSAA